MKSKISASMVGVEERSSVSRHPVHSWNDSQITERRFARARFAAIAGNDAIFTTHHAHVAVRPPRGE